MNAMDLLRMLQGSLERENSTETEEIMMILKGDKTKASAIVNVPVEGMIRLIEVQSREIGFYKDSKTASLTE
jgi:hypothetical protein